jgi:hypothetical protein
LAPLVTMTEPHERSGAAPSKHRWRKARWQTRLRRWLAGYAMASLVFLLPRLYMAYMWLVEVTSRHDDETLTRLIVGAVERHDRVIALLWHQEVFSVAYNYRKLYGHTLASVSDFGDIITEMLRRCNFVILRGGSGSKSRKRHVLPTLIEHMETNHRVMYGLTVDGSRGPVHKLKPGGPMIARACRAPVLCVRTRYRRGITLPTWDRAQIPLPFNRRITLASGPYWIAPDADAAALETFREHLEGELLELTDRVYAELGTGRARHFGFPRNWKSRWVDDHLGVAQGPYDLDPNRPPPWAHYPSGADAAQDAATSRVDA